MSPSLTVVIPAYNEQDNLAQAIDNVERALEGLIDDYEIIVVDDGSRDRTAVIAQERGKKDARIQCLCNDRNRGCGYSYWRGVSLARKDYVSGFPADNEMSWGSLRDLVKHMGQTDIISSYMSNPQDRPWPRRVFSRMFVVLMNIVFNMRLRYFNGYFIGRRDLVQALTVRSSGLTILAECKVRLIKKGCSYLEIPFVHTPRHCGASTALRFKSIKEVIAAVLCLHRDMYWRRKDR